MINFCKVFINAPCHVTEITAYLHALCCLNSLISWPLVTHFAAKNPDAMLENWITVWRSSPLSTSKTNGKLKNVHLPANNSAGWSRLSPEAEIQLKGPRAWRVGITSFWLEERCFTNICNLCITWRQSVRRNATGLFSFSSRQRRPFLFIAGRYLWNVGMKGTWAPRQSREGW